MMTDEHEPLSTDENRKWFGLWPGFVVSNSDPERRGRIRVRVEQVYGTVLDVEKIEDFALPWAEACFPVSGISSGFLWVPPIGASVWVSFWMGDPERPVWLGGWISNLDHTPEFLTSYQDFTPKTAVLKTDGGQFLEMRWVAGQEKIQLVSKALNTIAMKDNVAEGGPKIEIFTPLGNQVVLDDVQQKVSVVTPGEAQVVAAVKASIAAPQYSLTTDVATIQAVTLTESVLGLTTKLFTGLFTATFLAVATLVALGVFSITGAGIVLATTAGAIAIGSAAGAKQALVLQNFVTDIFNLHTHVVPGVTPGPGTATSAIPVPLGVVGIHTTQHLVAD